MLSWPEWLSYNALASAPRLRKPTLMVHSEHGAIPDGVRRYAAAMPVAPVVKWMAGTQFDFYDDPDTVDAAVAEVAAHFDRTLWEGGTHRVKHHPSWGPMHVRE